jgi:hypothetical protein
MPIHVCFFDFFGRFMMPELALKYKFKDMQHALSPVT